MKTQEITLKERLRCGYQENLVTIRDMYAAGTLSLGDYRLWRFYTLDQLGDVRHGPK